MFEFTESFGIEMPNISRESFAEFSESENGNRKLVIEIAALHAGLTSNFNNYPADQLEASLKTWVDPYPKPIILNHDPTSDPMGRVMAARMDKEADGTPFTRIQVAVMNPEAIERVMDGRYISGSVGGKAQAALCSICGTDWAKPTENMALPCKHKRGQVYNGKLAYFNLQGLEWKEYSFVNIPADRGSGVLPEKTSDNPEWIKSARFFSVNMSEEKILELTESDGTKNILDGMKKKDAHYTYMNVKGTFLTATAYDYKENMDTKITFDETNTTIDNELSTQGLGDTEVETSKESEMSAETQTEDILSITEQLSADLAASNDSTPEASENDLADETSNELSEGSDEETDLEESQVETKEEGEEGSADAAAEEQLSDEAQEAAEEQAEQTESADAEEQEEVEESDERDSIIESLREENGKLKKALHHMLAERVVDAKIALGLVEADDRSDSVKEHAERTASSLADSLRDLEKQSAYGKNTTFTRESAAPTITPAATAVAESDGKVIEEGETEDRKVVDPLKRVEDILVNKLLNR